MDARVTKVISPHQSSGCGEIWVGTHLTAGAAMEGRSEVCCATTAKEDTLPGQVGKCFENTVQPASLSSG